MRRWIQAFVLASVVGFVLLAGAPAQAQRTGDHIVPSIETVCDGDPFSFGLCNAYCEALDCESPTPLGTPRACSNLLRNYKKKSGGAAPPCGCPCGFNLQADINTMVDFFDGPEFTPSYTINPANGESDCSPGNGFNGEDAFIFFAHENELTPMEPEASDEQGGILYYWVDEEEMTCNVLGRGLDGPDPGDDSGEQFILEVPPAVSGQPLSIPLLEEEVGACQIALEFLCGQT